MQNLQSPTNVIAKEVAPKRPPEAIQKRGAGLTSGLLRFTRNDVGFLPVALFVLLGLIFGGAAIILTPTYQGPDEPVHTYRIWQLSEGQIVAQEKDGVLGGYLPCSLVAYERDDVVCGACPDGQVSSQTICAQHKIFAGFPTSAVYLPVMYLPQIAMAAVAHAIPVTPAALVYLLRIAGLLGYLALAATAIAVIPFRRWTMFMIALLPMALWISAMVSGDGMTLGLAMLFVALWLRAAEAAPGALRTRDAVILGVVSIALILAKPGYGLMALMLLTVPWRSWARPRYAGVILAAAVIGAFALQISWSRTMAGDFVQQAATLRAQDGVHLDAQGQRIFLLNEPLQVLPLFWNDIRIHADYYLTGVIGVFGWYVHKLPVVATVLGYVGLVGTILLDEGRFRRWRIFSSLVISAGIVGTLWLMLYVAYTPVRNAFVDGFQTRYLLPLLPMVLSAMPGLPRRLRRPESIAMLCVAVSIILQACMCIVLYRSYVVS